MPDARLVLFTRYPEPGKAKTRLMPALGEAGAADVHRQLTERTVATMRASGLVIEIRYTGTEENQFEAWLGTDLSLVSQGSGDLGDRLRDAIGEPPVIFVGADCPDLTTTLLHEAADALAEHEVVIGPAEDGGYWLIGISARFDWLFTDMEWGTEAVLPETLRRLAERDITPKILPTLADCDRPEDLARWPWLAA